MGGGLEGATFPSILMGDKKIAKCYASNVPSGDGGGGGGGFMLAASGGGGGGGGGQHRDIQ